MQQGLNPENKANRVANYAKNMHKELGIIAHSCGVAEPRRLKPFHARIRLSNGQSMSLEEFYPEVNQYRSVIPSMDITPQPTTATERREQ